MRPMSTLGTLVLALILVACTGAPSQGGGDDGRLATTGAETTAQETTAQETDDGGGDDGGAPAAGGGECTVDITGDETAQFTSGGGSAAVGTDYWFSEAELEAALETLGGDAEDREPNEPVFWTLIINCGFTEHPASISILPGADTTYDDVPFSPGTYTIVAGGALGGEVDRRRRALLAAVDLAQPE